MPSSLPPGACSTTVIDSMYLPHFGFTEWPFSNTPDPRFVYLSPRHEEALAHLLYGVRERGGFVQLTGEVGTGKTTTCRYLLSQLPEGVDVALVLNPLLTPEELLATVCDELGVSVSAAGAHATRRSSTRSTTHLLAAHARGRRTVLIIDEAQNLERRRARAAPPAHQSRDGHRRSCCRSSSIGQPELRRAARAHATCARSRSASPRAITCRRSTSATTRGLRRAPPAVAGRDARRSSTPRALARSASGLARRPPAVNVICDRALLGAFSEGARTVSARTVRRAAREVAGEGEHTRRWRPTGAVIAASLAVLVVAAGVAERAGVWRLPSLRVLRNVRLTVAPEVAPPRMAALTPGVDSPPAPPPPSPAASVSTSAGPRRVTSAAARPRRTWRRRWSPSGASPRHAIIRRALIRVPPATLGRWTVSLARGMPCRRGDPCRSRSAGARVLRRTRHLDRGAAARRSRRHQAGYRRWRALLRGGDGLDGDLVTLQLGERPATLPLATVDKLWDGTFSVVWRSVARRGASAGPGDAGTGRRLAAAHVGRR